MSRAPDESPAGEYERRSAERRERARQRLEDLWVRFAIGLPTAAAGACGLAADGYRGPAVRVWSFVALTTTGVGLACASAAFAAAITLRHRPVLTRSMVVTGLTPWAVVLAVATLWLLA